MDKSLQVANEALEQFRAVAFWNWRADVTATPDNLAAIIKNLREYGGHSGYRKAAEILLATKNHATPSSPEAGAEWAQDSNFRFFPLVQDEELGFRLHDADLATNKILALAGRQTARDFLDALFLHQGYLSLRALMWAASGKDPGLTPEMILNEAKRENRFSQEALEAATSQLDLVVPIDVVQTKETWLKACQEAEVLFESLPLEEVGCLYLDGHGKPRTPGKKNGLTPHFASPKGTLPRVLSADDSTT